MRGDPGFASEAYLRAKAHWKGLAPRRRTKRPAGDSAGGPFGSGRDPRSLGEVLAIATRDMGWSIEFEQARLVTEWPELVGETVAQHTSVVELRDGALIVQCDSSAWTTELRRLRGEILTRIAEDYPDAEVEELRFLQPGAPSWRHGPRSVPGRGPRDTYG